MCKVYEFKQPKTLTPKWEERAKDMAKYVGETLIGMAEDMCDDLTNEDEVNEVFELFIGAYNAELENYISEKLDEES